jgi:hypothetical protein
VISILVPSRLKKKRDETDMSEQQNNKKHKGEQLSENAEIGSMANNVEQEELQPVLGTKYKKKKRHIENEGDRCREEVEEEDKKKGKRITRMKDRQVARERSRRRI